MTFIADLHCDLLSYLEQDVKRTPHDPAVRCSLSQLKAGFVKWQTLAIFTETDSSSVKKGLSQLKIYQQLLRDFPLNMQPYQRSVSTIEEAAPLSVLIAFENASGFCGEQEPLKVGMARLNDLIETIAKPFYISLTWNWENRFGGGSLTQIGLKEEGKLLLKELDQKQIAIDLSHTSDALAYEIIDYIDQQSLTLPLIASHSNARTLQYAPRNLPTDIAKEIFKRNGLIGLNLYAPFLGEREESILEHLAFWLELGGEDGICLGTDFFYEEDFTSTYQNKEKIFFSQFGDASTYPTLLEFVKKQLKLSDQQIDKWAYQNVTHFLASQLSF
ncbi:dipeptidase [Candidatus Protochlamydia sp. W-9]|uniref:dipeptidase n=1 Tax=Candidatus Protochlamydia sp. W-9 TaxID=1785087 RepID=UPI00096A9304|nr:membrane dipeptidase [Candidatus Protochlamydia sp. W-9]